MKSDVIHRCRSVAPEQLLEYPLGIFGVRDRISSCPPISEGLVIVTEETDFLEPRPRHAAGSRSCPSHRGRYQTISVCRWGGWAVVGEPLLEEFYEGNTDTMYLIDDYYWS